MPAPKSAFPTVPSVERRQVERAAAATSGRCGFCGSKDTFAIAPESFPEWALERWGDAALLRCHDCGRRQAIAGLAPTRGAGADFRAQGGMLKLAAWAVGIVGAALLLMMLFKSAETGPASNAPFRLPRETPRPNPSAPAQSPPSGPLSLRSTPASVA